MMMNTMMCRAVAMVAFVSILGFSYKASHNDHTLCAGFIPENNLSIPIGWSNAGLTEQEFNDILDRIERLYKFDIEAQGDTLTINRHWASSTVNASANRSGKVQHLNMFGGLARHPAMTVEGFALVACHELGHHNGGAPKTGWLMAWATNEGGSDYFATSKCLRRFFAEDDNAAILATAVLDPTAVSMCEAQFSDEFDRLICLRTSLAGQSTANFFYEIRKEEKRPQFNTPDTSVVTSTNNSHPATQCRLDTYFAGMLCVAKESEPVSNTDYKAGTCYAPRDIVGVRPRCWFYAPK